MQSLQDNVVEVEKRYQLQLIDMQRETEQETNDRIARMRELADGLGTSSSERESTVLYLFRFLYSTVLISSIF